MAIKFLGVDIGFDGSKGYCYSGNGRTSQAHFPSMTNPTYKGAISGLNGDSVGENFADPPRCYGFTARDLSGHPPSQNLSKDWIYTEQHEHLFLGVCHQCGIKNGDIVDVCISLPYEWYRTEKKKFKNFFASQESRTFTPAGGRKVTFQVRNVIVTAQMFGAALHQAYTPTGKLLSPQMEEEVLIVDIGGKTAQALYLRNFHEVDGYSGTFSDCGSWEIVKRLRQVIISTTGDDAKLNNVLETLDSGEYRFQGKWDFREEIATIERDVYDLAVGYVKSKAPVDNVPVILVVGGTGQRLFPHFEADYTTAILGDEPIMAGAKGNALYARIQGVE